MFKLLVVSCSLALAGVTPALAAECPGNPAALGTSRVIKVDPTELRRVGTMNYSDTLPLQDHEVVLTFDDGPLSPWSAQILNALRAECVHATFFVVGNMAKDNPATVRRAYAEGHTIATHSQSHRVLGINESEAEATQDLYSGIDTVATILGNRNMVAPFYRFPGFGRSEAMEQLLAARKIMVWSADFDADDWTHISSDQVIERVLSRLHRKGRGILVLHDNQPRTARAVPRLLGELRARHYRIVHVVPTSHTVAADRSGR